MIEGWDNEGRKVLINPRYVLQVYSGPGWCNVQMADKTLHRFSHAEGERVYAALKAADIMALA
jgi:hypothetical protein